MSDGFLNVQGAIEDTDTMINIPDGFDSRKNLLTKPCFHGIHRRLATS